MTNICSCTTNYSNTGQGSCTGELIAASRKIIIVPKYNAAGTLNKITLPQTLNSAYFNDLLNNPDRSVRWYPLKKHNNGEISREAVVYNTYEDGSKYKVHDGIMSFKAVYPASQPSYAGLIKSGNCNDLAAIIIDKKAAIVGQKYNDDGSLYPFWLNRNTLDAMFKWATDKTESAVEIMFEFDTDLKDEDIVKIDASSMSVNLLELDGLQDAEHTVISTGQTSVVFDLFLNSSNYAVNTPVTGLLVGAFAAKNATTNANIPVLTATESTTIKGRYTLTYASVAVATVIAVTPTRAGIDFWKVTAKTSVVA